MLTLGGVIALGVGSAPWLALAEAPGTAKHAAEPKPAQAAGMVGFTRESAEAFHETTPAKTPVAPSRPVVKSASASRVTTRREKDTTTVRRVAARRTRPASNVSRRADSEKQPEAVVVRRKPNRWPRFLRGRWAGPLERIHVWWNYHFDRRHFDWPGNPPRRA